MQGHFISFTEELSSPSSDLCKMYADDIDEGKELWHFKNSMKIEGYKNHYEMQKNELGTLTPNVHSFPLMLFQHHRMHCKNVPHRTASDGGLGKRSTACRSGGPKSHHTNCKVGWIF